MSFLEILVQAVSWICMLSGSFFVLVGAFGALRLPDFWSRLHAVSITDSGGMILLILGMCLQSGFSLVTVKLLLIGVFLIITGPTSSHAIANAALVTGLRPKEAPGLTGAEPQSLDRFSSKENATDG